MIYTCKICGAQFDRQNASMLKVHLRKEHGISIESYIRQYEPEKGGYCKTCGKETAFLSYNRGFSIYCSNQCSEHDVSKIEKTKAVNLERYGVDNVAKSKKIQDKIKQTNLERYGVAVPSQLEIIKEKAKQTCLNRYNEISSAKSNIIKEKIRQTNLQRYGVEFVQQNKEIKEKSYKTCQERYGVAVPNQSKEVQEKIKKTMIYRYGVKTPFLSQKIQEKIRETNLKRYGVAVPNQSKEVQERIRLLNKERNFEHFKNTLLKIKNIQLLNSKNDFIKNDVYHFHCNIHDVDFESSGTNYQTVVCPKCRESHSFSYSENMLFQWLSQYISCEQHNRTILDGKELDIFIPSKRIAIEFDGLYWHSNEFKNKNYHLKKTLECESHNVQLIHVFENEWCNSLDIVKSIILAKLGIFQERISARKCEIKELSNGVYKEFLEENHLQGYVPATVKLGLFYEDKLVQICSFGKSRFHKGDTELLRQCSLQRTQIIGGFSKLLNYYIKNYSFDNLVTYCDRRYSNGSGYLNSGWKLISETEPNYFYFKGLYLESRLRYQKHKQSLILECFDKNLTEQENMYKNGYRWIYDCGNLKLRYSNDLHL